MILRGRGFLLSIIGNATNEGMVVLFKAVPGSSEASNHDLTVDVTVTSTNAGTGGQDRTFPGQSVEGQSRSVVEVPDDVVSSASEVTEESSRSGGDRGTWNVDEDGGIDVASRERISVNLSEIDSREIEDFMGRVARASQGQQPVVNEGSGTSGSQTSDGVRNVVQLDSGGSEVDDGILNESASRSDGLVNVKGSSVNGISNSDFGVSGLEVSSSDGRVDDISASISKSIGGSEGKVEDIDVEFGSNGSSDIGVVADVVTQTEGVEGRGSSKEVVLVGAVIIFGNLSNSSGSEGNVFPLSNGERISSKRDGSSNGSVDAEVPLENVESRGNTAAGEFLSSDQSILGELMSSSSAQLGGSKVDTEEVLSLDGVVEIFDVHSNVPDLNVSGNIPSPESSISFISSNDFAG